MSDAAFVMQVQATDTSSLELRVRHLEEIIAARHPADSRPE